MSLINDALKQAQKNQPAAPLPPAAPALRMPPPTAAAKPTAGSSGWLVPVLVIALIVAAVFIIGLASSRNSHQKMVAAEPAPAEVIAPEPPPAAVPVAAASAKPTDEAVPEPPVPVKNLPRLQGIFYSPTSPSAIIDGKTVRLGDRLGDYHVRQINRTIVILVGLDGKPVQLTMN